MKQGDITRTVVSKGTYKGKETRQVILKTYLGQVKGKPRYSSKTKHERD